jgi:hypothetical protein
MINMEEKEQGDILGPKEILGHPILVFVSNTFGGTFATKT